MAARCAVQAQFFGSSTFSADGCGETGPLGGVTPELTEFQRGITMDL
jgi:hypothetical protein